MSSGWVETINHDIVFASAYATAGAVRTVRYHSVAALTVLVWNAFLMLDNEVDYIWTMPNTSPFKWLYFFFRYVVIAAHITHNMVIIYLDNGYSTPLLCKAFHAYGIAFTQILATSLEILLATRVFALFNRSRKVGILLAVLIAMEVGSILRLLLSLRSVSYEGRCILAGAHDHAGTQGILGFCVHCALICLTLWKHFAAVRSGWGRTPLVSLVVRDGLTVYIANTFLLVSVLILCGLRNERATALFFWATSLSSISGSFIIVRLQRFSNREMRVEPSAPIFTSEISLTGIGSVWR